MGSIHQENPDANLALMDLEKGLRSSKTGEKCEAISRVPQLLEAHPFPILVNSACLKIADAFRTESNFLKVCVLKTLQGSKKHLNKIFNVEEFSMRFFTVIHSNDPIARAITLRVFGCIAPIVAERKDIQHCIGNSLDSNDTVEVEAAIFAMKAFAEQSSTFAAGIWQKVADMVQGVGTAVDLKIKLLPIFKFIHRDFSIVTQVTSLCVELMETYPSAMFVSSILNTMTQLSLVTLVNINQQVELLLRYMTEIPQKSINMTAVRNLHTLAKKISYLWTQDQIEKLVAATTSCIHHTLRKRMLDVVLVLSNSTPQLFTTEALETLRIASNDMCIDSSTLAFLALTNVLSTRKEFHEEMLDLEVDLQALFSMAISEESIKPFKRCLQAASMMLCKTQNTTSLPEFFVQTFPFLSKDQLKAACRSLVTSSSQRRGLFDSSRDQLLELLEQSVVDPSKDVDVVVGMVTLILQLNNAQHNSDFEQRLSDCFTKLQTEGDFWLLFRIARQASRLMQPKITYQILRHLQDEVSTESFYFWLKCLSSLHEGEAMLLQPIATMGELQKVIISTHNHYQQGLTYLKAAVTVEHHLHFQFTFTRLRSDLLKAYLQLLSCCSNLSLNPPLSEEQASQVVSQFQHCCALLTNVSLGYENLYKCSFNADKTTLATIKSLHESCQVATYTIKTLICDRNTERLNAIPQKPSMGENSVSAKNSAGRFIEELTEINLKLLKEVEKEDLESKDQPLNHKQAQSLITMVTTHLRVGFPYPLYFYKALQNTNIQLSATPRSDVNAVTVNITSGMTLKVEGVVTKRNKAVFRDVEKVRLTVRMTPTETAKSRANDNKPIDYTELVLCDSSQPEADYFSAQFLIGFKYLGGHVVRVDAALLDETNATWEICANSLAIRVDVFETGVARKK